VPLSRRAAASEVMLNASPMNATMMIATMMNASSHRALSPLDHEFHHSGTFCMGGKLAPLVLLLGCQRCGTASLYDDMMEHVKGARYGHALVGEPEHYGREQHFYATDAWSKGVNNYLNHFPPCPAHGTFNFVVDATPAYLRKPIVAERLPQALPNAALPKLKFMLILRDPKTRLYAYWDTFVLSGTGVNNFDSWVGNTLSKVTPCQKKNGDQLWPPPENCDTDTVEGVAAGLYAYQLIYWLHRFDAKQFFITTLDAYENDPGSVLKDAARFIGADGVVGSMRSTANMNSVKVMGGMSEWARKELEKFYRPHNAQLLHLFNNQNHVHYSPSLKALGIQAW